MSTSLSSQHHSEPNFHHLRPPSPEAVGDTVEMDKKDDVDDDSNNSDDGDRGSGDVDRRQYDQRRRLQQSAGLSAYNTLPEKRQRRYVLVHDASACVIE